MDLGGVREEYHGKANMDLNSPDELREKSAGESSQSTRQWLEKIRDSTREHVLLIILVHSQLYIGR